MKRSDIDGFFRRLADELGRAATVILTGAGAAALQGAARPSRDLDFALRLHHSSPAAWKEVEAAVERTVRATGIEANYAEDIERWGMITLLDYDRHALKYKTFGTLRVLLLHPAYWSIGKMTRYLQSDAEDMEAVFRSKRIPWASLVAVWKSALERSPRSPALAQFKRQARDFLTSRGPSIWGKGFDSDVAAAALEAPVPRRKGARRTAG